MASELRQKIRDVPDFPVPGIVFKDITTLLVDPQAMAQAVDQLMEPCIATSPDKIACIDSRGFIFGGILAHKMGIGFVPLRKSGKLPAETYHQDYKLEYGQASIEMHKDAIKPGERVLVHDDLLATGGTAEAACQLVRKAGGTVVLVSFLIELGFLNGRGKLHGFPIHSLLHYDT